MKKINKCQITHVNDLVNYSKGIDKKSILPVFSLTSLEDGELLVGDELGRLNVWRMNPDKIEKHKQIIGHSHMIDCSTIIDRKKSIIATGSQGELNSIRVWNISEGVCLSTLKGHRQTISALVTLEGGRVLGSASHDGTIKIWDWKNKEVLHDIPAHGFPVLCLISTDNEEIIISGSDDYKIKIWRYETEELLVTINKHQGYVSSLCWLQNWRFVSGSANGQIFLWDLQKLLQLHTSPLKIFKKHRQNITGFGFLRKSNNLISVSEDKDIIVWDLETGSSVFHQQQAHNNTITAVAVSIQQNYCYTAGWEGIVKMWKINV